MLAPIEFGVRVKNDPNRLLKGLFQGKVTTNGLGLRQKNQDIAIPVGNAVEYLGKNRLSLAVEGRQVEIEVTGKPFGPLGRAAFI